jgi:phage terminase large subunit GpA-like protein
MSAQLPKQTDERERSAPKSSVFISCPHCSRRFRQYHSRVAQGRAFCSLACYRKAWHVFKASYADRNRKQLQEAA